MIRAMNAFQRIKAESVEHRILFMLMHILFWMVFFAGTIVAVTNPQILRDATQKIHNSDFAQWIGGIYKGNSVALAVILTFGINLLLGCVFTISLPAFFIPALGIVLGLFRAYKWGILFLDPRQNAMGIPYYIFHFMVMVLEGEAYIVAIIAGCRVSDNLFHPQAWISSRRLWSKFAFEYYQVIVVILLVSAIVEVGGVKAFLWLSK